MRLSSQVKPISYLKANTAEVLLKLAECREPLVITQNGEAKAVLQDVASYGETQETLALLKILALGNREIEAGDVKTAKRSRRSLAGKTGRRLMAEQPYRILLTAGAERDSESLYDYLAELDTPANAATALAKLLNAI